ncbi:MAG: CTP synthase [Verrucomicrobia bacterium]|nr:CTP synthase [Verrucomicrobiota bacterium]MDA1069515.1 CTP synthase [Verrucomicrobiota bacterium]
MKKIGIIAEYTPRFEPHPATSNAIEHSREFLGLDVEYDWVSTEDIENDFFENYDGLWVVPGSPYKNMERTLWAIRYAREHGVPTSGTCGGFQPIILEYARNLLGFKDAQHAEYDPYASKLFISELACSLAGREMDLHLEADSQAAKIYGVTNVRESYYCNFAVNPEYLDEIQTGPIKITGSDAEGEVRVIEYSDHPFFIATRFVPQTLSTPDRPHPLVNAFLKSITRDEHNI